jgi:hypothetical protein
LRGGGKRRKTFYRWRKEEENACNRSEQFDASLHFLSRPIRHQSQISGFRNQLAADRTIWKWVVEQHIEDANKEGRDLSRQEAESTAQCVWILDCW